MNYYEHHLGDYAEATAHLSMLEDGAYGRLLRKYYASEKPLPPDLGDVQRLVMCRTPQERRAVEHVLREFFRLEADGWHQARCDEEIARFRAKSESARQSAGIRWNRSDRKADAMRTHSDGNANGMRTPTSSHDVRNALQSPVSNPQAPEDIPTPNPFPPSGQGNGLRSNGTNPRARGENPRANGTHRRAERDEEREELEEAKLVWSQLLRSGGAKPARDARIQDALDAIGGWQAVRVRTEHEEPRLKRDFCHAYTTYRGNGHA